ncbi:MAG: hypothetical protein AB7O45_03115 [Alphaproteobacteria bacterium]
MIPRIVFLIAMIAAASSAVAADPRPATDDGAAAKPAAVKPADPPATGIDPSEIRKLFTERLSAASLASCDVFEVKPLLVEEVPKSTPVFRMSTKLYYLPNHGAIAAVRQKVEYLRQSDKVKAPFDPKLTYDKLMTSRMDYPEFADSKLAGDYVRIAAMGEEDRLQFLMQCGLLGNCTCVGEGLTPATRLARTADQQFAKFEPLVAQYVAETFKESATLIEDAQREEIYQGLIDALSNDHALASRLVDVVVARLAAANDTRVANLLAAKLASDERLRASMKGVFDSVLK